jgi:two-component system sensor histidine kinase ChiS
MIKQTGIKFILLNSELVYITSSTNVNKTEITSLISALIKIIKPDVRSLNLENDIVINDIKFSYLKKADKYPFYIIVGEEKTASQTKFINNILPSIIELLFLGIICTILLYYSRMLLVKPIIELSQVAKSIASNGGQVTIPLIKYHEAQVLADQLKEIQSMKSELEKALAAKTEFLNNMSHEIRTPIQGFTNVSEGLVEHWQDFDDNRKLELASTVASNAKRLASLIGNLLDLSKLNAGKMMLDLKPFDLNEAIFAMIEECHALYLHDKQLTIHFEQLTSTQIMADKERIMQVLRNLFINAIRFSPSSGSITVKLAKSEITYDDASHTESVHFVISDQGVGIPQDELEAIFCSFTQSTRTKTKAGGTGLGLAIAKEIIKAHQGKIWAKNNAEGGASFEFILPHAQTKQMDGHFIVAENAELLPEEPTVSKAATILMVDDEEACLISMEMLLHGTSYRLIKQSGGHAALDYLKAHPRSVDIIMLDLMMPDMYGLNVLAELKQDPDLSSIPVILQSGSSDTNEIEKAYQLGAVAYIKKPYLRQVILTEINKLLV